MADIDNKTIFPLELCTMPGFAGSPAYYLRYMDPHNDKELVVKPPTIIGRVSICILVVLSTLRAPDLQPFLE